jgi:hypothetical protein
LEGCHRKEYCTRCVGSDSLRALPWIRSKTLPSCQDLLISTRGIFKMCVSSGLLQNAASSRQPTMTQRHFPKGARTIVDILEDRASITVHISFRVTLLAMPAKTGTPSSSWTCPSPSPCICSVQPGADITFALDLISNLKSSYMDSLCSSSASLIL